MEVAKAAANAVQATYRTKWLRGTSCDLICKFCGCITVSSVAVICYIIYILYFDAHPAQMRPDIAPPTAASWASVHSCSRSDFVTGLDHKSQRVEKSVSSDT